MLKKIGLVLALSVATPVATQMTQTDFRYRTVTRSHTSGLQRSVEFDNDEVTYIQGSKIRRDLQPFAGPTPLNEKSTKRRMIILSDCATRETYTIDPETREYVAGTLPQYPSEEELEKRIAEAKRDAPHQQNPPNLRVEVVYQDTEEERDFFGYKARKFIITQKHTPLTNSSNTSRIENRSEAWVVPELNLRPTCEPEYFKGRAKAGFVGVISGAIDSEPLRPEIHSEGEPPTGFPAQSITTSHQQMRNPDGTVRDVESRSEYEVVEFSTGPLDPTLFEVPSGFRKVKVLRQP